MKWTATLAALGIVVGTTVVAPPIATALPSATWVRVADGTYGQIRRSGDMVDFTVRERTIVNPRFSMTITCQVDDEAARDVVFGPTPNHHDRHQRIVRNGEGAMQWREDADPSGIRNADVRFEYRFRRSGKPRIEVSLAAHYRQSDASGRSYLTQCSGFTRFRVNRGPLDPTAR